MHFTINGRPYELTLDVRTSLLDVLRDHLRLTGTKKGCNQGACGACTVLVEGERINACLALAVQYQGCSSTTGSSADTARPARSVRRSPWRARSRAGSPARSPATWRSRGSRSRTTSC